jgi:bifunctional non-homologous end joining protein LigD
MQRNSEGEQFGDLSRFGTLAEYNRKRRFAVTPEPPGKKEAARKTAREFVVQKHRASHLHYDFRLEHDGVMMSWAVPKGPSLDPSVKRLAMRTEDHPLDYNDFEGVIPEGEYGGGTVMIWDRGTWEPDSPDVGRQLAKGDLKFTLRGRKLQGSWVLVRTRDRQWLLIKHRDAAASTEDLTVTRPLSVVSRRTMAGIARAAGATERQLAVASATDPPRAAATPAVGDGVTAEPRAAAATRGSATPDAAAPRATAPSRAGASPRAAETPRTRATPRARQTARNGKRSARVGATPRVAGGTARAAATAGPRAVRSSRRVTRRPR